MKKIYFDDYEDLSEFMMYSAEEGKTSYAILFYNDAKQLLKELSAYPETEIDDIILTEPMYKGYNKEYYVVLDDDFHISVEEAWHEKNEWHEAGYNKYYEDNIITLLDGDASSKAIDAAENGVCYEIEIKNDSNDDDCYVLDEVDLADMIENILDKLLEG